MTIGALSSPERTISLIARPGAGSLAVAEPADASRQALERDLLLGQRQPAVQRCVLREELHQPPVGAQDVLRVA